MAKLTLTEARNLMLRGRPWTFKLKFQGAQSSKFWQATGRAMNEPVEIHYGTVGGPNPVIMVKDWSYVEATAPEKESRGYVYVDTPFVRVRPETIAAFQKAQGMPPTPPPPPAPVAQVPVPSGQVSLPGPWGKIAVVQCVGNGTWAGLDGQGNRVLSMTKDGARNLVWNHPHISVAGL